MVVVSSAAFGYQSMVSGKLFTIAWKERACGEKHKHVTTKELDRLQMKKGQIYDSMILYVYKGYLFRPDYTLKELDSCVGVIAL